MPQTEDKDVAQLLDDAIQEAGISQYELAKRMAEIRGTYLGSQDQAIRRIRRLGQIPTEDVARDLAQAFAPDLDLDDDYFFTPRSSQNLREAIQDALVTIERLQGRVDALERALKNPKQARTAPAAPKRSGSSRQRQASR